VVRKLTEANQLTESSIKPPQNVLIELIQNQKKLYFLLFKFLNHSSENLKQSIWDFISILPSPTELVHNIIEEIQKLETVEDVDTLLIVSEPTLINKNMKMLATFNNRRFSFENEFEIGEIANLSFENKKKIDLSQNYLFEFSFGDLLKNVTDANLYKLSILNVK
jgi:hypothetical protein